MLAGMTTNGFYLNVDRIERLNRAGLQYLQISIDNVEPDDVSQKSLKTLDRRLQWLSETARFHVNINSVVGGDQLDPQDALAVASRAAELGFSTSVGLLHDSDGQLRALTAEEKSVYEKCVRLGASFYTRINRFQRNLIEGRPNDWHCLAGARFLYVCEDGLVHWCSQQRGYPGIPLEKYGKADLARERATVKACAPMCTIGCVQRVSAADNVLFRIQGRPEAVPTVSP
jgi:MoaA/NifB/PqqE/SkfB family radical SAM enzyme